MSNRAPLTYEQVHPLIDRVPGSLMAGQERYLFNKVRSLPDDAVIVEIGSAYGRSSCALAFACAGSSRRLICIDPWTMSEVGNIDFFGKWKANIDAFDLAEFVTPLRGRSDDVLANWRELTGGVPIDFIFIDGCHYYSAVRDDLQRAFSLVKDNGWIALHDVIAGWPGPVRVWKEIGAPSLRDHEYCGSIACGRKTRGATLQALATPTDETAPELPVHYFTVVDAATTDLAVIPKVLQELEFAWCWHVIVPLPLQPGEQASAPIGRGTVTLHAPPSSGGWPDGVVARNALLASIGAECLLWELDPTAGWTAQQLATGRVLFTEDTSRTGIYVRTQDDCPVGPNVSRAIAWHYHPWFRWVNAAVPELVVPLADGGWYSVASANAFTADEALRRGMTSRVRPNIPIIRSTSSDRNATRRAA